MMIKEYHANETQIRMKNKKQKLIYFSELS